jgi:hypothetical protein
MAVGQARDADAGVGLVADVDADEQRGELLGQARHLELAAVDAAQPVDALDERDHRLLVGLLVAADEHVLVERVVEVAEDRGAHRVQRGDDPHALGDHLGDLLGSRALPHADRPRRLAGDRRRQRDRRVDDELPRAQVLLEVRQRLGLRAERHRRG